MKVLKAPGGRLETDLLLARIAGRNCRFMEYFHFQKIRIIIDANFSIRL